LAVFFGSVKTYSDEEFIKIFIADVDICQLEEIIICRFPIVGQEVRVGKDLVGQYVFVVF